MAHEEDDERRAPLSTTEHYLQKGTEVLSMLWCALVLIGSIWCAATGVAELSGRLKTSVSIERALQQVNSELSYYASTQIHVERASFDRELGHEDRLVTQSDSQIKNIQRLEENRHQLRRQKALLNMLEASGWHKSQPNSTSLIQIQSDLQVIGANEDFQIR